MRCRLLVGRKSILGLQWYYETTAESPSSRTTWMARPPAGVVSSRRPVRRCAARDHVIVAVLSSMAVPDDVSERREPADAAGSSWTEYVLASNAR
jgi:hypothetical protein